MTNQDPDTEFDIVARDAATRMADLRERGFSADDCRGAYRALMRVAMTYLALSVGVTNDTVADEAQLAEMAGNLAGGITGTLWALAGLEGGAWYVMTDKNGAHLITIGVGQTTGEPGAVNAPGGEG